MINVSVHVDLNHIPEDLRAIEAQIDLESRRIVYRYGALLQTEIRKNASTGHHKPGLPHIPGTGPGPNVATGDYRRSIARTPVRKAALGGVEVVVSSNAPQAWRLERGFVGQDALGRYYNDPPRPHWEPAIDVIEPAFEAAMLAMIDAVTRWGGGTATVIEGLG